MILVIDQFLVIVSVTVLILFSPGPDMVIVTRNTIMGGSAAGMQTSLGVLTGNLVHISYCVVGIGLLISQSIVAFSVLRYAGAAYLIYLGITSFFSDVTSVRIDGAEAMSSNRTWYLQGFINNALNPKGALFYLGVFTMVITPETTAAVMLILIATMMLLCGTFWAIFVHALDHPVVRGTLEHSQQMVSRIFGTLLVALGLRVALLSDQ